MVIYFGDSSRESNNGTKVHEWRLVNANALMFEEKHKILFILICLFIIDFKTSN